MNIVKGVADLLRRSSGGQAVEGGSWTHAEKHPVPSTRIRFSETGGEAILSTLWQRYENTIDKVEKRKSLQIFLLHFVQTFKNWEPENDDKLSVELASSDDIILGCSSGHPSEVILILVQEIARLTSLVSELNCNAAKAYCDASEPSTSLTFSTDGLYVLNCLMIANRSLHNCKVFSYYGGVQKVTALLKAAVVQLKTLTSVVAVDEQLSSSSVEKISVLQKILGYVVSIVSSFMELYSSGNKNVQNVNFTRPTFLRDIQPEVSSKNLKDSVSEARIHWKQRAIVLVMEAGGVNWLVELLRVIRRLNLKEQWTDLTLHYFTLGALKSALFENPRAQNHFRSIGGLEVLLDGIGPPSNKFLDTRRTFVSGDDRNYIFGIFQLQVVSMEVLRESVFANMNNLQFLCENGRIHKYANSVCWPTFMLQEFKQLRLGLGASDPQVVSPNSVKDNPDINPQQGVTSIDMSDGSDLTEWSRYSIRLSRALCSFLLAPEDIKSHHVEASVKGSMPVSVGYWELSIRWIMKVLLTIFPCIKACSNEKELPSHIRVLANTMQHCILCTFRKVLFSAPALLEVFREEGIWDMIFSKKFFYFGPSSEELDLKIEVQIEANSDALVASESYEDKPKPNDVDFLQLEAISFLEYAATLSSNTNNLPECSVLLDAFEQSAHSPELATIFLRSLQQILQLTAERSLGSLKSLDAVTRVLKVACIQAQEIRKFKNYLLAEENVAEGSRMGKTQSINSSKTSRSWIKCMRSSMELFNEYLSIAEHVRSLVLHNASCIDCLFDLIWEESLRKQVLEHIVGLLKLPPLLPDDGTAKLHLCSKYLEAFTRAKEREEFFPELSIDLLVNMREILSADRTYYQRLFCDGECFLHIVSLLNGTLDEEIGEQLVLNVLHTLTLLLSGSSNSKVSFRALVGVGYQTFQSLLLDFCKWQPSEQLLNALFDMLVDGKFDSKSNTVIKNDDVILLFFNVLQKSSTRLQHYGLEIFQKLLKDSMTNQTSCFRAGLLTFLLDWFAVEENDKLISQIAQLIQVIGGHSISGKDIRKIFALLRSEAIGSKHTNSSLLLKSLQFMLKEKGPEAFFEFNGNQSGILINTPLQWPYGKGFSFSCWLRVEDFPEHGVLGLFSFHSDNGRGCSAMLGKEKLIFESINQKRHCVSLPLKLHTKNWHFFCITHTIGRAFSGGSSVRCYVDGELVSSEKCRYAKVGDTLTRCTIGAEYVPTVEGSGQINYERAYPFIGQMGPLYMFGDTLISEQIKGIYSLGPSYMYSFLGDEIPLASQNSLYDGILDSKDGLSSKIIFGLNAQASSGSCLFNVSSMIDNSLDKNLYVANILDGTELCSRRLLQEIIYCVGGVSVFFPLLTQYDGSESDNVQREYILIRTITRDKLAADIVDLIASVLDGNLSNQQQILRLSGLSILGFLFQSVPPQQLNMETLSALKHLFDVLRNSGISELLLTEAISRIYLNPHIWVYASYEVQRDLYMFLIQYFENEATLLPKLCGLPRFIDIIRQFYWGKADSRTAIGSKPLLHSITKQVIGERPGQEEVHKIRLLLLSLAEMSLRQRISSSDIKALIAFFERSQDMVFIEDVLHMIIRALSHKELLGSFLEQVNLLGGSHIFINLLQRELEPIRLLGLQFLGKLLVGAPSEKKGTKFFNLSVGRTKSISGNLRKGGGMRMQPVFCALSERLSAFPLSDDLYATLFDVLLGGASLKQVLQKRNPSENPRNNKHGSTGFSSHFVVPQIIVCIFKYLASCHDTAARTKILGDLLDLLESDLSNTEALMENAWSSWLATSMKLIMFNNCEGKSKGQDGTLRSNEIVLLRNLYCIVLSHYVYSVKGGWHQLEETVNFLLLNYEQGEVLRSDLLRHIFNDLVASLFEMSSDENIFVLQPCRDNSLYLLKLADELLISESGDKILFPEIGSTSNTSSDLPCLENQKDISSAVLEILNLESNDMLPRIPWSDKTITVEAGVVEEEWWVLYDKLWILISEMSGKGQIKTLPKSTILAVPSFGQRARGLVESLNIPAAEMAAVVVSGGIGTALGAKPSKYVDKAMLLRGEKFPRIVFHLLILYLSKAALERASRCVQQFISLLPCLLSCDDDQSRNMLHFLIWSLHSVRSQHGMLDEGARFHVISHLILEIVNYGKSILATSILGREDTFEVANNTKETGFILSLIQQDRVLAAAVDEAKYIKATKNDRQKQLQELRVKLDEFSLAEHDQWKAFEEDITSTMNMILSSDDSRKTAFRLAYDEDQQIVADKWIHMFRTLIDERGPWSANPFPNNNVTHWKLDKTEDNWRRRPKLKRNYKFDKKLCYPPNKSSDEPNQQVGECIISEGSNFPEQMKHFLLKGVRGITEEREMEPPDDDMDLIEEKDPGLSSSSENQVYDYIKDGAGDIDISNDRKDLSSVSAETDLDEVHLSIFCVLISPKRKLAGHLLIMQTVLHFAGQFLVEGTGGSSVLNKFCDVSISDPKKSDQMSGADKLKQTKGILSIDTNTGKGNAFHILAPDNLLQNKPSKIKMHRRWSISKIKAVHLTRYLLQYTAIEIFFSNSVNPIFLNFATPKDAKLVGSLVVTLRNESLFPKASYRDRSGIISFVDRRVALEMAETFRESWRRREISNFEYLMILNTLSGRSYNDLTQYPVFPWILADYSSEQLDFNKSSTFRDLSKPVGALDSKRFEVFEERFRNFSDPDIPSFHYGSHYSSMGIVLFYLLRMEPFTALHRNLQGGKFDHADRLFQSIEGTYRNCLSNTSDVKELIPEFFYMPEFLANCNSYHFGVKQDGEAIGDAVLPPWAKGSPEEFIYRNREALESEYVSSNLHQWIDLVFGYKQRGKPAVEAANVFYYLTYEGAVDLESMEDELQISAIEDQIANFGQTPIQIFRKKHPRRGPPIPIARPLYFAPSSIMLTSIIANAINSPYAIIFVGVLESSIVVVNHRLVLSVKLWLTTQLQSGGNYTFSGSQEPFFGIGSDVHPPRKIGTSLANDMEYGGHCLATMYSANEHYLILCGNWENSFQVISVHDGNIIQSIHQHKDLVTCVAVTSDGSILATGSYDTTVMIWHAYRGRSMEKKSRSMISDFHRKEHVIIETPFHILCGHDDIITCLFISLELDIVISGSKDGTCVFHTLREGRYVRSIRHPLGCSITKLVASQHGRMVIYADNDLSLHMYSVNGKHIASAESNGRLNCIELSGCGDFLICAGDHGQIVLRSMHSLDVLQRFEGIGKVITSLSVTPEECILAGTKDGSLLVYSIDNPQVHRGSLPRNSKSKVSAMG